MLRSSRVDVDRDPERLEEAVTRYRDDVDQKVRAARSAWGIGKKLGQRDLS